MKKSAAIFYVFLIIALITTVFLNSRESNTKTTVSKNTKTKTTMSKGASARLQKIEKIEAVLNGDSYVNDIYILLDEDYSYIIDTLEKIETMFNNNKDFDIVYNFFENEQDMFPSEDYYYKIKGRFEDYYITVSKMIDNISSVRTKIEGAYSR